MIRPVLEGVGPLRWLGLWLLSRRHPSEVTLDGLWYHVNPRDFGVTLELHSTGTYEPFARGVSLNALEPGQTFLDVGAHVGLYTIPAARQVGPDGRVIAFEPHPGNRALLEANIQRNQVTNVTVVAAAVSDSPGELELQLSPFNTGDHRLHRKRGAGRARTVTTQVVSLDGWCEANGVERVDQIKIDVQGAEARVLQGAAGLINRGGALQLILEYTPWMLREAGALPRSMLDDLIDAGFALSVLDESAATLTPADVDQIERSCPGRSYVNILATRTETGAKTGVDA